MKNTKTIIALVCTLIIGFIFGFFLSGRLAKSRMDHFRKMMNSPRSEQMFLSKKLNLSKEQKNDINPILDSMLPIQVKLRKQSKQAMDQERKVMIEQIKPHLNAEQLEKLQKMHPRRRPPHPGH